MAENFIGPYYLEIKYDVDFLEHTMAYNLRIDGNPPAGTDFSTITCLTRDGSSVDLLGEVNAWCTLVAQLFSSGLNFKTARLSSVTPGTNDKNFISATALSISGTNASPTNRAHQDTWTFLTQEGGKMRLTFLESAASGRSVEALAGYQSGVVNTMWEFVVSDANWILARDTSYPVAALNRSQSENERLFRRRFRQ